MTSKPIVIFVPGAWHTPESFALVAAHLEDAGYEYTGVDKPSVSLRPPYIQSFEPDVEAVRKEVLAASDAGNDVVLVMHSYGGIPGSAAAKGLSKEDREKEGKKGGIVRLVYISSFAIEEGQSLISAAGGELSPWCIVEGDYMRATESNDIFYRDIPKEEAQKWTDKLQYHATKTFHSPQTYTAFKHIPSTYLICEDDQAIPAIVQEMMSSHEGGLWTVERLKTSHSPFLSKPKEAADVIRRAAGENI